MSNNIEELRQCKLKLMYFDKRANAEAIRFILAYSGLKYDDIRIDKDSWNATKNKTHLETLPILYVNKEEISSTMAICRYLANMVALAGDSLLEKIRIDSIVEYINDLRYYISEFNTELPCSPIKRKRKEQLQAELIPKYLHQINIIAQNGFIANDKLSWGDFFVVAFLDYACDVVEGLTISNYENLKQLHQEIHSLPTIKDWIEKRPSSLY